MKNARTRIKICGITRPEDARCAADCGADAIGLVFYADSPRAVDIGTARDILRTLPAFVTSVGLFVNSARREVEGVLEQLPLDCLQFHGDEQRAFCESFGRPYIKAVRVRPETNPGQAVAEFGSASGILLDAWHDKLAGGTGQTFDWDLLAGLETDMALILAGGLTADNVAAAVTAVTPYAVDVSSGVEEAPGRKSAGKIARFVEEVERVGNTR